jgi:Uma2 family endonuclease
MPFQIDDAHLPAILKAQPMTDEEFAAFCAEHADLNFEMTADGELIVMAPAYCDTSASNCYLSAQLGTWANKDGDGVCCGPSAGFVLPNGARRSPDVSWTLKRRVEQLEKKRNSFWRLCPDFVVEMKSGNEPLKPLRQKMVEYLEQGAQLGWLIDPETQTVEIYRPGGEVEKRADIVMLEGEGPVAGFALDLTYVWDPFAD